LKKNNLNPEDGFEAVQSYLNTPGLEIEELISGCLYLDIEDEYYPFDQISGVGPHSDDVA